MSHDENSRLEWSSPVSSVHLQMPFLVSFLNDCVEIHDIGTLICLQRIPLSGALSLSISGYVAGRNLIRGNGMFVSTADQISHFSMIPLPIQVRLIDILFILL